MNDELIQRHATTIAALRAELAHIQDVAQRDGLTAITQYAENQKMRADLAAARARIAELEALIIEADAQYCINKQPEDIETAMMALVMMAAHGADALVKVAEMGPRIEALEGARRWVSVKERLPEPHHSVLAYIDVAERIAVVEHYPDIPQWTCIGGLYYHGNTYGWVTHWRPLPGPPEGEGE